MNNTSKGIVSSSNAEIKPKYVRLCNLKVVYALY